MIKRLLAVGSRRGLLRMIASCGAVLAISLPLAAQTTDGVPKIAFVTLDYDTRTMTLSTANPDGTGVMPLVEGGFFSDPAWSPDGSQLAFIGAVREFDDTNLFVINSDGSNLHAVFTPPPTGPDPAYAAWSPDGTRFIFGWENAARDVEIYTMNVDGSDRQRIRFSGIPGLIAGLPGELGGTWAAWSPDGTQIAVLAWLTDGFQIYVSSLDGSTATPFPIAGIDNTSFERLTWSPDGQHAVLLSYTPSTMEFQAMAVASGDGAAIETTISPPPNNMFSAAWSPDSSQIVFVANELNVPTMPQGALYVMNADGSNLHALTVDANIANRGTSWGLIPAGTTLPTAPVLLESAG
ncbi:MAG: WD40 domain-containing protein [Chloroflexi bacterium OLB15]|nr:MAG: WD40 domain-containing protein [Chloroflexi bacterium OLB15]